jgi:very-short-patch-repair endonuclease
MALTPYEAATQPQQGLVTARQLRGAGISRGAVARARADGRLVRVRPQVYAATPLPPWPVHLVTGEGAAPAAVLQVRAVLLSLGDQAVAAGSTAAWLRGWGMLNEPRGTVTVLVPHGRSRARLSAVRVLQRRSLSSELVRPVAGDALRATSAVRTALDCCLELPHRDAVVVVDSALRSGQVSLRELAHAARRLPRRLVQRVLRVLSDADPASGSVLESVTRLELRAAGIGGFETQVEVRDRRGRRILRVDFCFEVARLVLETDGAAWHQHPSRDQGLDNRLAAAGWRVLRVSWALVVHDPRALIALVQDALASTPDIQPVTDGPAVAA